MRRISRPAHAMVIVVFTLLGVAGCAVTHHDTLPSWNEGSTKAAIIEYVEQVTAEGGPHFVPPEERVAVFDNDGTLWVEHPIYTQLVFALDRLKVLAPRHPEWKQQQPLKAALDGDLQMLQWTTAGNGLRFALIVHHTDAMRCDAYGRNTSIGHLDKALDEAQANGWTVADMKRDWKVIFPFEKT